MIDADSKRENSYRLCQIPEEDEISEYQKENFDQFFDPDLLEDELKDWKDIIIIDRPEDGKSDEEIGFLYEQNITRAVEFITKELLLILVELRMLPNSDPLMNLFDLGMLFVNLKKFVDEDQAGDSITDDDGVTIINLSTDCILPLLTLTQEDPLFHKTKASIVRTLSHELFHRYLDERYKVAAAKTEAASKDPEKDFAAFTKYLKDRGEIAANLYEVKHLCERAKQIKNSDANLSLALNQEAELSREEAEFRTNAKINN